MFNEKPIKHLIILLVNLFNENNLKIYKNKIKRKTIKIIRNIKPSIPATKFSITRNNRKTNITKQRKPNMGTVINMEQNDSI